MLACQVHELIGGAADVEVDNGTAGANGLGGEQEGAEAKATVRVAEQVDPVQANKDWAQDLGLRYGSRPEAVQEGAEPTGLLAGSLKSEIPNNDRAHEMRLLNREILRKAHKGVGVGGWR